MPSRTARDWPLLALLAAIAALQFVTVTAGHDWGDDFALYVLHARALLEGKAYADTGFVYHSLNAWYSPRVYPPGFPLLLLPLLAVAGANLFAMKLLVTACLIAAVALFARLARPHLPQPILLGTVALLGFQPYLTEFKNHVLPDLPFLAFVMLALLLLRRLEERPEPAWSGVAWGMLAGATAAYAMALRTIGVALFAGLCLSLLLRRRFTLALLVCLLTGLAGYLLQRAMLPPASGYANQLTQVAAGQGGVSTLLPDLGKARALAGETYRLWQGLPDPIGRAVKYGVLLLAIGGYGARLRRFSVVEGFVLAYAALVFVYPARNFRYLMPLVPFLLYYAAITAALLVRRWRRPAALTLAAVTAIMLAGYARQLAGSDFGPVRDGADTPAANDLYAWVDSCAGTGDRFLFRKARALTLFTRRPALTYPRDPTTDLARFMAAHEVRFVAVWRGDWVDRAAAAQTSLATVYQSDVFAVYGRTAPTVAGQLECPLPVRARAAAARAVVGP